MSMVLVTAGVIVAAVQVKGLWETTAVLLVGGPLALFLGSLPLAIGEALRALADIGDAVLFEPA